MYVAAAQVVDLTTAFDCTTRGLQIQSAAELTEQISVLIIEDDAAVADMYRLRLVADGYLVVIAETGQEGVRIAKGLLPDFIYLDLRLPGLDGLEVLEELRASPMTEGIPVIVLSNYSDPELVERGLKLGATGFLIKADTTPRHLSDAVARTTAGRLSVSR